MTNFYKTNNLSSYLTYDRFVPGTGQALIELHDFTIIQKIILEAADAVVFQSVIVRLFILTSASLQCSSAYLFTRAKALWLTTYSGLLAGLFHLLRVAPDYLFIRDFLCYHSCKPSVRVICIKLYDFPA